MEAVDLDGGTILRFVGWNTESLCNDNQDRGHLDFPVGTSTTSVGDRKSNEIVVVLTHHDLDWIQERTRLSSLRSCGPGAPTCTCPDTNTVPRSSAAIERGAAPPPPLRGRIAR